MKDRRMRTTRGLALLGASVFAGLVTISPGLSREASPTEIRKQLERILAQPEELRTNDLPIFRGLLEELRGDPDSPLVELILMRLRSLARSRSMRETLARSLREIEEAGIDEPFNAHQILGERLQMERTLGVRDPAEEERFLARTPRAWWVIGPFGIRDADCIGWRFPPEKLSAGKPYDLQGAIDTPWGARGWKRLDRPPGLSAVPVGRVLDTRYGAVFAVAQISSPRERIGILEFGCRASLRVWWNEREIISQDRHRGQESMIHRMRIPIRRGWNRILVKLECPGADRFTLRIHGERGEAIDDLIESPGPTLEAIASSGAEPEPHRFRDALAILESHAGFRDAPVALAAMAWLRLSRGELTASLDLFRRASQLDPKSANLAVYLGGAYARSRHLTDAYRGLLTREAYQRALEIDDACIPAIVWFAFDRHAEGDTQEAFRLLERATGLAPWNVDIDLMQAELCRTSGWDRERAELLERALQKAPGDPSVLEALADFHLDEGRVRAAIEFLERAIHSNDDQLDKKLDLAVLYQRVGEEQKAGALLERQLRERPESVGARLRLADFHLHTNSIDEAEAILLEGVRLIPSNSRFPRELGDLCAAEGRNAEAIQWYRKHLALRPDAHQIRRAVGLLEGESSEPYFDEFRLETEPLLASKRDYAAEYPRAASAALLDDLILRFYEDGSARMMTHQIYRILNEQGIEEHSTVRPGGTLHEMRTVRADGRVLEPISLGGDEYTLPGLEIGAAAEWRTESWIPNLSGTPLRMPTFYFQDVESKSPFVRSRYVIIQPRGLRIRHIVRNYPWRPVTIERGDDIITIYDIKDLGQLETEPFMPEPLENVPQVTLVEPRTWKELNQAFRLEGKVAVTPEIRERTADWIHGVAGQAEQARVLYEKVNEWVRDPRSRGAPTETLHERRGNRIRLYLAMLEAAGIDYQFARARRNPEVELEDPRWDWLREDLFPNPLVRVLPDDGRPVWVVMAARGQRYGQIPSRLFGSPVFMVDDDEGTVDYLPLAPIDSEIRMTSEVDLTPVGLGFEAKIRLTIPVAISGFWKDQIRSLTATQKRSLGFNLTQGFLPGTVLDEVVFTGVEEQGEPVVIEATVRTDENQTSGRQNMMALRLGFPSLNLMGRYATAGERTHPLLVETYDYRTDRMRIHLGPEYRAVTVPEAFALERFLGRYRIRFDETRDGIEVVREVSFRPTRIVAEDYPEFMKICRQIDDREAERIWLLPLFNRPDEEKGDKGKESDKGDRQR